MTVHNHSVQLTWQNAIYRLCNIVFTKEICQMEQLPISGKDNNCMIWHHTILPKDTTLSKHTLEVGRLVSYDP